MKSSILYVSLLTAFFFGCKDINDQDKYQRPEWLAGKLYTQISLQDNLSSFAECLRITGYDTILDVSGSFTVFAPSDEAINDYLNENHFAGVSDIPKKQLEKVVEFHIIQDAWSINQFSTLDFYGWIDPDDPESEARAYKRQTLLKNPNEKYWVKRRQSGLNIVDSTESNDFRKVFTRSRKYAPIYFDDFFDIFNLSGDDYSFYYDRPYESGNVYYAGAKIAQSEIFAENGFIYVIDRVVPPMLNAKELLERELPGEGYNTFLDLIYQFPEFHTNLEETYDQLEAREGGIYDTLYNLSFPKLPFNIHEELTGPSYTIPNFTYIYQNGMYIPTNEAFQTFIDEVVTVSSGYPHWASFEAVPQDIKSIIVNTHFTSTPVYATDIRQGFEDGDGNIIYIDESDIIRKEFGSNTTFLGLNKTVVPRAFSSVTGPVYLRPGYSVFMYAMQYSKVLTALIKEDAQYGFFPVTDQILAIDSSLIMEWEDKELNRYRFSAFSMSEERMYSMSAGILAKRIMNQVSTSLPNGSANKEYLETLGGNYIIWNNQENTVQGGIHNTFGYKGVEQIIIHPEPLEEPTDNGKTWNVTGWFSNTNNVMYGALSKYTLFAQLLDKAGLYDRVFYKYNFLTDGEYYTVFVPSEEALLAFGADTLQGEELESFLKYHFVKGDRIFTDNKKEWLDYETLRLDESSTEFSKYYSSLNIRPGPDQLEILDKQGSTYVTINERGSSTNILVGTDTDPVSSDPTDFITTAVIHEIDKVLIKQ